MRARKTLALTVTGFLTLLATATPASAQQLIDASEDGDLAFAAFAFMCIVFVGCLFAIDRVRKRHDD
mgnify:CR=1 FL=1